MNWRVRLAAWLLKGYAVDGERGIPVVFADRECVDFEYLPESLPFYLFPARRFAGRPLADSFHVFYVPKDARHVFAANEQKAV